MPPVLISNGKLCLILCVTGLIVRGNYGKCLMQLIEVQIGDYLEEDDIVRLTDKYGRI